MSTQASGEGCQISVLLWGGCACIQTGWVGLGTCTEWILGVVTGCARHSAVSAIMGCHCGRTAALQWDYWDSCRNWAELEIGPTDSLLSDAFTAPMHTHVHVQTNANVHLSKHFDHKWISDVNTFYKRKVCSLHRPSDFSLFFFFLIQFFSQLWQHM